MMFEEELYSYLSIHTGLSALISTRIYPNGNVPQTPTVPYCVYMQLYSERAYSHDGFSGLEEIDIQISCYATTELQSANVAKQVILALEAWPGANNNVKSAFCRGAKDLYNDQVKLNDRAVDFSITHTF